LRKCGENCETRLVNADVLGFFDATRLEVADEIAVEDGRFSINIVIDGSGTIEGDFGKMPVKKGDAFACSAALGNSYRTGRSPLKVVRCMGPLV
jgi:mannose-6-phosphate isomerase class I